MPSPQEVSKLIERFTGNRDAYRSHGYNETRVCLKLMHPSFKALG